jgi:hypothetical protein
MVWVIRKQREADRKQAKEQKRNGKKNKTSRSGVPEAQAPGRRGAGKKTAK